MLDAYFTLLHRLSARETPQAKSTENTMKKPRRIFRSRRREADVVLMSEATGNRSFVMKTFKIQCSDAASAFLSRKQYKQIVQDIQDSLVETQKTIATFTNPEQNIVTPKGSIVTVVYPLKGSGWIVTAQEFAVAYRRMQNIDLGHRLEPID
jgi:hypothetical protein